MAVFLLNIMNIPTQKGEHSCKCTELSLKRKEEIDTGKDTNVKPVEYRDN